LIADIGSGTGALTELFLKNGNCVFAVEPNREMREGAEHLLSAYPGFHSVAGRAESTNLSDRCVDFAVVGQAFHWFGIRESRREFLRILNPDGWAMVVWNERDFESTPFLIAYDRLLQHHAPDYARVKHKDVYDTSLKDFFGDGDYREKTFKNSQILSFEGLKGRLLSSSYTPEPGHPNYEPMLEELSEIFHAHSINDLVTLRYLTRMYYGRMVSSDKPAE
jgi:SAM-dependent methyltransferase